jgi:UDP-hydrolysing UDP-N-acetyl-D-glucosamine 2-epimerase
MTRRVAVFSATRADLWPLTPLLRRMVADDRLRPTLLATGAHLSSAYGDTLREIGEWIDVVPIDAGLTADDSAVGLLASARREAEGVAAVLDTTRPDLLILLGDRYELLGVAQAALLLRVPIVHLHGGDVTEGAFDDSIRHAITKLASLHCCATELAACRIRAMGEEPWRIHITGAPALDGLKERVAATPDSEWQATIGGAPDRPFGVVTFHPPTIAPHRSIGELDAILATCGRLGTVVATSPGADPGAQAIIERLHAYAPSHPDFRIVASLGASYAPAVATADVVIGNSSSGIVEVPTFGVPVVNVGDRQAGRERPAAVIDAPTPDRVDAAVTQALDPAFRARLIDRPNPYGDGQASPRIVEVLAGTTLDGLLAKKFAMGVR